MRPAVPAAKTPAKGGPFSAVTDRSDPPNPAAPSARCLAIALSREQEADLSPRVVAKGHGKVAEQILQIAFDRGVKVRSDRDLAEVLEAVELESEVPLVALAAVAEILTYVYRSAGAPGDEVRP